ncbi:hypothetical protein CYMTET_49672 [Cymbomonas tetramitiformis]|uniref:Uncharacterized protein n=1 Tax=Cymbomonas tetramitiformis TaxID=36881 RepID=A0AAE0ETN0_9CHLO|nr:hypothetical protein CYMTET_49672 [Cymbomonas tetramitiformis]
MIGSHCVALRQGLMENTSRPLLSFNRLSDHNYDAFLEAVETSSRTNSLETVGVIPEQPRYRRFLASASLLTLASLGVVALLFLAGSPNSEKTTEASAVSAGEELEESEPTFKSVAGWVENGEVVYPDTNLYSTLLDLLIENQNSSALQDTAHNHTDKGCVKHKEFNGCLDVSAFNHLAKKSLKKERCLFKGAVTHHSKHKTEDGFVLFTQMETVGPGKPVKFNACPGLIRTARGDYNTVIDHTPRLPRNARGDHNTVIERTPRLPRTARGD